MTRLKYWNHTFPIFQIDGKTADESDLLNTKKIRQGVMASAESLRSQELILSSPIGFLVFRETRYFLTNCSCMSVNLKKNDGVVSQEETTRKSCTSLLTRWLVSSQWMWSSCFRGTQRGYSSKPLNIALLNVYPLKTFHLFGFPSWKSSDPKIIGINLTFSKISFRKRLPKILGGLI